MKLQTIAAKLIIEMRFLECIEMLGEDACDELIQQTMNITVRKGARPLLNFQRLRKLLDVKDYDVKLMREALQEEIPQDQTSSISSAL